MFSKPKIIARIQQDFIPLALKAGTVANPPEGLEGDLYRELRRTQPAPQGICAVNSAGKVLAWALMFENDESVLGFLDHVATRYAAHPDGAVASERFMCFPGARREDVADNGITHKLPAGHAEAERCAGDLRPPEGWLRGRVIGRAIDANGQPLSDARTQDNYIEDVFEVTPTLQDALRRARDAGGGKSFPLPAEFGRLLAGHAYLGQLDVNPCEGDSLEKSAAGRDAFALWARARSDGRLQVWGTTHAAAKQSAVKERTDGRQWEHRVSLQWHGYLEFDLDGKRIAALNLIATGEERLRWGSEMARNRPADVPAVSHLPAGRPIDFEGRVWYGVRLSDE